MSARRGRGIARRVPLKYSVIKLAPRMLRAEDAGLYVGAPHLLQLMERAGWIKPSVRGKRMTLYDVKALDGCCDRLARGDFPAAAAPTSMSESLATSLA